MSTDRTEAALKKLRATDFSLRPSVHTAHRGFMTREDLEIVNASRCDPSFALMKKWQVENNNPNKRAIKVDDNQELMIGDLKGIMKRHIYLPRHEEELEDPTTKERTPTIITDMSEIPKEKMVTFMVNLVIGVVRGATMEDKISAMYSLCSLSYQFPKTAFFDRLGDDLYSYEIEYVSNLEILEKYSVGKSDTAFFASLVKQAEENPKIAIMLRFLAYRLVFKSTFAANHEQYFERRTRALAQVIGLPVEEMKGLVKTLIPNHSLIEGLSSALTATTTFPRIFFHIIAKNVGRPDRYGLLATLSSIVLHEMEFWKMSYVPLVHNLFFGDSSAPYILAQDYMADHRQALFNMEVYLDKVGWEEAMFMSFKDLKKEYQPFINMDALGVLVVAANLYYGIHKTSHRNYTPTDDDALFDAGQKLLTKIIRDKQMTTVTNAMNSDKATGLSAGKRMEMYRDQVIPVVLGDGQTNVSGDPMLRAEVEMIGTMAAAATAAGMVDNAGEPHARDAPQAPVERAIQH